MEINMTTLKLYTMGQMNLLPLYALNMGNFLKHHIIIWQDKVVVHVFVNIS